MVERCAFCGSTENLQEHHELYDPGMTITVCKSCHKKIHNHGTGKPQIHPSNKKNWDEYDSSERLRRFVYTRCISFLKSKFDEFDSPKKLSKLLRNNHKAWWLNRNCPKPNKKEAVYAAKTLTGDLYS